MRLADHQTGVRAIPVIGADAGLCSPDGYTPRMARTPKPLITAPENEPFVEAARLTRHPQNPRKGDLDGIEASMRRNGWFGVVVAQRSTGHILVGNHRFIVWTERLGHESIPLVQWLDVDDETALRILAADNRTSDLGGYDEKALAELLSSLASDLGGTGYAVGDLDALLAWNVPNDERNYAVPKSSPGSFPDPGMAGRKAKFVNTDIRSFIVDYAADTFEQVAARFQELRAQLGAESNAAVLLHLLGITTIGAPDVEG